MKHADDATDNATRAVVFVNPFAGGGKAARRVAEVREAFAQKDFAVDVETPHSAEELRERVRTAINAGCKTLIGMGGDGTMQALVREALGCPVSFGVIPLGGGNDFAAALGIGDWKEGVSAIVEGKVREVDVVRARFANGDQAAYLGGGGMGLDTEAMRYANGRFVRWPGRLRYLASAIAALRGYAGVKIKVDFPEGDTSQIEKHVLLAAVLNTPSYGSGVRLAPNASIDDGELELVTVEMLYDQWKSCAQLFGWPSKGSCARTTRNEGA